MRREYVMARRDERQARFDGKFRDDAQVDPAALKNDLAARDTRYVEQIIDETDHLRKLAFHDRANSGCRSLAAGPSKRLQARANRRQRIAKLVRQRGQKLIFAALGVLALGGGQRDDHRPRAPIEIVLNHMMALTHPLDAPIRPENP